MCKRCVHKATETEFAVKVRNPSSRCQKCGLTLLCLPGQQCGQWIFSWFISCQCCLFFFFFFFQKMRGLTVSLTLFLTPKSHQVKWKKPFHGNSDNHSSHALCLLHVIFILHNDYITHYDFDPTLNHHK